MGARRVLVAILVVAGGCAPAVGSADKVGGGTSISAPGSSAVAEQSMPSSTSVVPTTWVSSTQPDQVSGTPLVPEPAESELDQLEAELTSMLNDLDQYLVELEEALAGVEGDE